MINKTITIEEKHQELIERYSINLSRFVQKKLDELSLEFEKKTEVKKDVSVHSKKKRKKT
ncbi:MAG: hypothetical protein ACTSWG_02465 [Candidatus Helarchaeota archaeon]